MQEIKTTITTGNFVIENYDEIRKAIEDKMACLNSMIYENIDEAKKERANLNGIIKKINDERVRLEKKYLEPFNVGKSQCNELIKLIGETSLKIDCQIKNYESKEKDKKLNLIKSIWNEFEISKKYPLEIVYLDAWINKTCSISMIRKSMEDSENRINNELQTLSSVYKGLDYERALVYHKIYGEINKVISRITEENKVIEIAKQKESVDEEEKVTVSFKVVCSQAKLDKLSSFMKLNNIKYEEIKQ